MNETIESKPHRFSDRTLGWSVIFAIPALVGGLFAIEPLGLEAHTCYLSGIVVGIAVTMLSHFLKK